MQTRGAIDDRMTVWIEGERRTINTSGMHIIKVQVAILILLSACIFIIVSSVWLAIPAFRFFILGIRVEPVTQFSGYRIYIPSGSEKYFCKAVIYYSNTKNITYIEASIPVKDLSPLAGLANLQYLSTSSTYLGQQPRPVGRTHQSEASSPQAP